MTFDEWWDNEFKGGRDNPAKETVRIAWNVSALVEGERCANWADSRSPDGGGSVYLNGELVTVATAIRSGKPAPA